jgi:hypothetical protein
MDHLLLLEDWAECVRRLKDETLDRFITEAICRDMLTIMEGMKFKRPELFVVRRGEDYELFTATLLEKHGIPNTMPILEDDEFFELCLDVRRSRKMNHLETNDKKAQAWVTRSSESSSVSGARRRSLSKA